MNREFRLRNNMKLSAKKEPMDQDAIGMSAPINLDDVERFNVKDDSEQVRGPVSPLLAPFMATRPTATNNRINAPILDVFKPKPLVSPSILGDNPEDVLKNMQIARNR